MIPSVNFHLIKACNMQCKFCYATFNDIEVKASDKSIERNKSIIAKLAEYDFEKITFAGGEPTLRSDLPELVQYAKTLGLVTCVVTNGTKLLDKRYAEALYTDLDWLALSIDSVNDEINLKSGRAMKAGQLTLSQADAHNIIQVAKTHHVRTKVNTVVSAFNVDDNMAGFIVEAAPERWKVLQALPVGGQNDAYRGQFEITNEAFQAYLERHRHACQGHLVPESNGDIIGSYIMIAPNGKFFDDTKGAHTYSRSILQHSVEEALSDITVFPEAFIRRGGLYDWKNSAKLRA